MIDFDSSWVEKLLQEHFSMELTTVGNLNEVGIAHSSGLLWFSDEYYILDHLDIKYLEKKKSLDIILSLIDGKLSVSEIIDKMGKLSPSPGAPDAFGCWTGVFVPGHDRPAVVYSGIADDSRQSTIAVDRKSVV